MVLTNFRVAGRPSGRLACGLSIMIHTGFNKAEIAVRYYQKQGKPKTRNQAKKAFQNLKYYNKGLIAEVMKEIFEEAFEELGSKMNSFHNLTETELTRVIAKAYQEGFYKCYFPGPIEELETIKALEYAREVINTISQKKAAQTQTPDH